MALASDQPVPHVPYRDATLTKMLKHVLNGNCVNMMLGCLNPTKVCRAQAHTLALRMGGHGVSGWVGG